MSNKYDVVIVGSGIGGLVCGCYLSALGLKTAIFEQHHTPGGYCTSFHRKNYRFDSSVHYLGAVKNGTLNKILKELNLNKEIAFTQFDPTDKIIMPDNITYIRANPFDTIEEFKKSFPKERINIERFFLNILQNNILSIRTKIKQLTFNELLNKYFNDIRIKSTINALLANVGCPPQRISALAAIILLREFILDPGYYPKGGMQNFTRLIVAKFKRTGGEIFLSSKIIKIINNGDSVSGVLLENGKKVKAKVIISNADATNTYKKLIGNKSLNEFSNLNSLKQSSSAMALYIGLNIKLNKIIKEECNIWIFKSYNINKLLSSLKENIIKKNLPYILVYFPSLHDNSVKSDTIQALINAPFESRIFWKKHKTEVMNKMLNMIKSYIPELKEEHISIMLGATPYTFYRYTSNFKGAIYGWESSLKQIDPRLIPQMSSVNKLILAGHWCTSGIGGEGGISGVATLGRNAARLALNYFKKDWPWEIFILK